MKMRKFLSLLLCLCMLLTIAPLGTAVKASTNTSNELFFEKVDNVVDLAKPDKTAADLAIEQSLVDENGMIPVFIIMEGKSVLENDTQATLNQTTIGQMKHLQASQNIVVSNIEKTVLNGETLNVTDSYTWLFNGVAATIPYSAMAKIAAMDGVSKVIAQPVYELYQPVQARPGASLFTNSDGVMVGREDAWNVGFTGQGMKIAIIDTGLDVDHQNFGALPEDVLTADSATRESVAQYLESLTANGLDR